MYLITEVPVDCTVHLCVIAAVSRRSLAPLTVSPSLCSTGQQLQLQLLLTEAISLDAAREVRVGEQTVVGSIFGRTTGNSQTESTGSVRL